LQNAESLQGEELLRYYDTQWGRYKNTADCLDRLFEYLNREGKQVYPVKTLAVSQWCQHILLQPAFIVALMKLVAAKRKGTQIDLALVKKVLNSLVSLDLDASDPTRECLDVYKEHFEALFLDATPTGNRSL
ncbi:Cullin repeat-like-containing domain protein, partial [Mycena olivaceomarginata]